MRRGRDGAPSSPARPRAACAGCVSTNARSHEAKQGDNLATERNSLQINALHDDNAALLICKDRLRHIEQAIDA
ncbi:hypothetical protein E2562_020363, partial [Oryza meyeriana var. granulata]